MIPRVQDVGQGLGTPRILLVEDEGAISLLLETLLEGLGCTVSGIATTLDDALALAESADIDVALLDINLAGKTVYPVAERLAARGIPFVFSTGYGTDGVEAPWRNRPVLVKPYTERQIEAALRKACRSGEPIRPSV